jgi:hypothetical protein
MVDTTLAAEFLAVVLFAACLFHSWNTEGRRYAQQWFFIGYIFSLLLVSLLVVIQQLAFNEMFLTIGAAPSLVVMFYPAILYLAYALAKLFADETDLRAMMYLMFLLTPALLLPLDATGVQMRWWAYPSESFDFLNGVPFYLPFAWGVMGAAFMYMMGRIRKIRFRGSGQLFAMMIAAPLLDGLMIVLIAVVQVVVNALAVVGGTGLLYGALGVLFIALPPALALNVPHTRQSAHRER